MHRPSLREEARSAKEEREPEREQEQRGRVSLTAVDLMEVAPREQEEQQTHFPPLSALSKPEQQALPGRHPPIPLVVHWEGRAQGAVMQMGSSTLEVETAIRMVMEILWEAPETAMGTETSATRTVSSDSQPFFTSKLHTTCKVAFVE